MMIGAGVVRSTRLRSPHHGTACMLTVCVLATLWGGSVTELIAQPPQPDAGQSIVPSGEIELARLVDLAAQQLQINIEYDPALLKRTVTLRTHAPLDHDALWALTNRLLAREGLTTVALAKQPDGRSFAVTRITEATDIARPHGRSEEDGTLGPGFRTVVVEARHVGAERMVEDIQTVLSKPQGTAQVARVGTSDLILISGLSSRIEHALAMIDLIDQPRDPPEVTRVELKHASAIDLVSAVNAVMSASAVVSGRPTTGKLMVAPSGNAAILVAPARELDHWTSVISSFDRDQGVVTRNYISRFFDASELVALLEDLVHADSASPSGPDDDWRVVTNEFTGALVVTATLQQHAQIEQILNELNTLPVETRRPIRTFQVRNRSVIDVVELLAELIEAGALESATDVEAATPDDSPARAPRSDPSAPTRTFASADVRITADDATSSIIAIGEPRMLSQLEQLITALDVRQPQVMLEVLIVSMSDGESFDLGVELRQMGITGDTLTTLTSLFGLSSTESDVTPSLTDPRGGTAVILNPGDFSVVVRALETINEGRSLNVPRVLVNNNEQATLDSVLQQPLLSVNASDTVATTSFGGTQDAGTQVAVTPQIAEGDHLLLEYTVTLSSFVGESSDPSLPPPRQQNTLASIATIPDGFVVAVGGLEVETEADAESKVPVLGDIPLVGEAFKNRSKSRTRSRFYVFIRPTILRHEGFADLRYISTEMKQQAMIADDTWPTVKPQIIF